jgi:hypothetical protein
MAMRGHSNGGLTRYNERVLRETSDLVRTTAAKIDNEATRRAPFKWGTLRRSISHRMETPYKAIIGSRGVPYARIQDLGGQTSNQYGPNSGYIRAKLYLTGTFEAALPEFRAKLRRILRP